MEQLRVWLDASHVATLSQRPRADGFLQLEYTADAQDSHPVGGLLLSTTLLVRSSPHGVSDDAVDLWVESLLPEDPARTRLARSADIRPIDTFGFLAHYGHDCAGAVQFLEPGVVPSDSSEQSTPVDLAEALAQLSDHPLTGADGGRVSLGGFQEKLVLAYDGVTWTHADAAHPSTHIIKPDPLTNEGLIVSEAVAMRTMALAGIPTGSVGLIDVEGTAALTVERFDREIRDGQLRRTHQESLCQSLGCSRDDKFQRPGQTTPSYVDFADVLVTHTDNADASLIDLLRQVVATVALGNTDAHGLNYAIVIRDGSAQLAPAYDVANTTAFVRKGRRAPTGLLIDDRVELIYLTRKSLVAEAKKWGVPQAKAEETVDETIEALRLAVPEAALAFEPYLSRGRAQQAVEHMHQQIEHLRDTVSS